MRAVFFLMTAIYVMVGGLSPAAAQPRLPALIPGLSDPLTTMACGIPFIPQRCTRLDRIVGGAFDGAVIGFGVGAIAGAAGGVVASGGAFAGAGTSAVAWSAAGVGAIVGSGTGAVASFVDK